MGPIAPKFCNFPYGLGRLIIVLLGLIISLSNVYGQCSGSVYDPGGSGSNYGNNANWTTTYTATGDNFQKITFTSFSTESGQDLLKIYDGPSTASTLLGTYSGSTLPPTITASGTTLTLKFTSNSATTSSGWVATLSCVSSCSNTTSGGTIIGDQVACGTVNPTILNNITPASGGSGTISYQWESSTDNSTFTAISGATGLTYDPPATITQTTYYRRKSKNSGCSPWGAISNVVTVTVFCPNNDCNVITNGEFNSSTTNWQLVVQSGNAASFTIDNTSQLSGTNSGKVNITSSTGTDWHVQLTQTGFELIAGREYDVSFRARTTVARAMYTQIQLNYDPYTEFFGQSTNLTSTATTFNYQFTPSVSTSDGLIKFNLGKSTGIVYIDNIIVKEACPSTGSANLYFESECSIVGSSLTEVTDAGSSGGAYVYYSGTANTTAGPSNPNDFMRYNVAVEDAGYYKIFARTLVSSTSSDSWWVRVNNGAWVNFNNIPISASWSWNQVWNADNSNALMTFFLNYGKNTVDFGYREPNTKLDKIYVTGSGSTPSGNGGNSENCPQIFICDSKFYQTIEVNDEYWLYQVATSPSMAHIPLVNLTTSGVKDGINSTVFNRYDGYIYTMNFFSPFRLYRIAGDYSVHYLGNVSGLPSDGFFNAADIGTDGLIYFRDGANGKVYKLDIDDVSATEHCSYTRGYSDSRGNVGDIAINLVDGKFYGTRENSNILLRYTMSACGMDSITMDQTLPSSTGAFYVGADGAGYGYQNASGIFNKINLTTGHVETIGSSIPTSQTDGCSCEGIKIYKDVNVDTTFENSTVTYTFTFHNKWISNLTNLTFKDTLKDGFVWSSQPQNVTGLTLSGSITTGQAIGGLTITNLPQGVSSFKLTALVPANYTGPNPNLNQAFVSNLPITLPAIRLSDFPKTPALDDPTPVYICRDLYASGSTSICVGATTQLMPNTSGTWTALNPTIATISSSGLVTGVSGGNASFKFTDTAMGCVSNTTFTIEIKPKPTVSITGLNSICAGTTTTLSPTTGGTWSSSNTAVATVTNAGLVTGIAAGTAIFTFTNSTTGCTSNATATVTIKAKPTTSITGSTSLCIGTTTTLSPTTGGTWASSSTAIATVTNAGLVTSVSAGTVTFTFTNTTTGCTSDPTSAITVNAKPTVSITGSSAICLDGTTSVSPTTGGTWTSSNTAVATVTNGGVVTGVAAGSATFTFTNTTTNCPSNPTSAITVNGKPTVSITGSNPICEGSTTTLSPTTGGSWVSSNTAVATVTNAGLVTGVGGGTATFTFTNTTTNCASNPTSAITITAKPTVSITGTSIICVGTSTTLSPTSGGTWVSSNTSVATVTNAGVVTGVGAGTATFTFTNTSTNCTSNATSAITVNAKPTVSISGLSTICDGATTTLSPNTGGTWVSNNTAVATVTNAGLVTGIAAGTATFTFTNTTTNCISNPTAAVTINAKPVVSIVGSSTICIGSTTTLSPTTGGTWISNNTSIATVTNAGLVTSVASGTVTFTFTNTTTGCISNPTAAITINPNPIVSITGSSTFCEGATTNLSPTSGGTWVSSNPAIATVTNGGVVTGVAAGSVTFTFTNSTTNCTSSPTATITINAKPTVSITGSNPICEGTTTTLSPTTGGSWVSSNTSVATVTNAGLVTGIGAGTATFTFTNTTTTCTSNPTSAITINAKPTVSITGSSTICAGTTTTISPTTGGTWVSSNTSVATVTNAGIVTGVGAGTATFTFTNTTTNCTSNATSAITVNAKPVVSITGSNPICEGATSTLSPNSGGTWTSSNTAIATVTNAGLVTGIAAGTATFTFTNTTTNCISNPTTAITVNAKPVVSIVGSNTLCIGSTTTLSPSSGGTWISSNSAIATVTNAGVVTAIAAGSATFTFTNTTTNCTSNATGAVTVNPKPTVSITGLNSICIAATSTLSPTSGGSWTSSNSAVATITNAGVVTGVAAGTATFTFTSTSTGCISDPTASITVNAKPTVSISGANPICIGATTTLSPSSGGSWASSNISIATVTNSGIVTGIDAGTAVFTFTQTSTGCTSNPTSAVTISAKPTVSVTGTNTLCIAFTTTLSPSSGGSWASSNPSVATVTNSGVVTAVAAGTATFTFTNTSTGCSSDPTSTITVNEKPTVAITGASTLCIQGTTTLSPATGGTWTSSNNSVATVTNAGLVTAVGAGTTTFTFTQTSTGCSSNPTGTIFVNAKPNVSITGANFVCIGSTTTLSPTTGGTWTSSNPTVATVANTGVVTAIAAGAVTFTFTETSTGCTSNATSAITIVAKPITAITGTNPICVGTTSSLTPSTGGSWVSSNTSVATITNGGIVTGIGAGTAYFTFSLNNSTCTSDPSSTITVNPKPSISITGSTSLCTGSTTTLSPTSGGTWASSNNAIATVTNAGVVNAISAGSASFIFTSSTTLCASDPTTPITFNTKPTATITGSATLCIGQTSTVSPTSGGTWTSSNNSIASVSNAGLVTAIGAGAATFTFTNTASGCISDPTASITVGATPTVMITGSSSICLGSTTTLSPTTGGTWISSNPAVASVTNAGIVTALTAGTASFTFTDATYGCQSSATSLVTINIKPIVSITGATSICSSNTTTLSPTTGGTWISSNSSIATVSNSGVVTGIGGGVATFRFTSSSTGCISDPTANVTIVARPTVAISGASSICMGSTTTLTPSSGGTWVSSNPSVATVTNAGIVTGVSAGTATFTFTNTSTGCISLASAPLTIGASLTANIDYNGSVCINTNSQLTALKTGGTSPYSYNWSGPSGYTGASETVNITLSGNYSLTITDASGCIGLSSGYVYTQYIPQVVAVQTTVCEGQTVNLTANGTDAISYIWGANAGNATSQIVTVTPSPPSTIYRVTVTNNLGCTGTALTTIGVNARPSISIAGSSNICIGFTTSLLPNTGGTWSSSNSAIATVTNTGIVTGVTAGTATFTFTQSSTGCSSLPSSPITINSKPVVSVTGANPICINSTSSVSPATGGTWTSSNPSIATVTNSGTVTGVNAGNATFTFTSSSTGCISNATSPITVEDNQGTAIYGDELLCAGQVTTFTASRSGGHWTSSNTAVATITYSGGVLTAVATGTAIITYERNSGNCNNESSLVIQVNPIPVVSITGPTSICQGSNTSLSPIVGGTWISNNPTIASVTNSGMVSGLTAGTATFKFTNTATGCMSINTPAITIKAKPIISFTGPTSVCLGNSSGMSPTTGGTWLSSNPSVASITNAGVIQSVSSGVASFIFTSSQGCASDASQLFTVNSNPVISMDYHGSICLKDGSQLSGIVTSGTPAYTYNWTGPSGFTGNTQTINIVNNGNYLVTVTDSRGCIATTNGFVYERYEPIIINLITSVCQGDVIDLAVSATTAIAYQWSANAGNSTLQQVSVSPSYPSALYTVTVTSDIGCTAAASASITVKPKPAISVTGPTSICVGDTSHLNPTSGGTWASTNPGIAMINNNGHVVGLSQGSATFVFTNSTTGCSSDESLPISVFGTMTLGYAGPNSICIGYNTQLTPSTGGTWVSNTPAIATITTNGLVTGVSQGIANFSYTNQYGCATDGIINVTVNGKPQLTLTGQDAICIGTNTAFQPNNGGTWLSVWPAIATITNSGIVTAVSSGTGKFIFTETLTGCKSDTSSPVIVLPRPVVSISGPTSICAGTSTNASPSTGGVWLSNNVGVASITNSGVISGLNPGQATFTFVNSTTSCSSLPTTAITINAKPTTTIQGPNGLCIGATTHMLPSTGGTWISTNPTVATINNSGLVTGMTAGTSTFRFTNSNSSCTSDPSVPVNVFTKPIVTITGPSTICIGGNTTLSPTSGGTWVSNHPSIATVNNAGIVTALAVGSATFTFTETNSSCSSDPTTILSIGVKPTIPSPPLTSICQGNSMALSPSSGGTWSSLNPTVASITTSGVVTGLQNGSARFVFSTNLGCDSDPTAPIIVNGKPITFVNGPQPICIGNTTNLSPTSGGSWVSTAPSIATVNNAGLVTGIAEGNAKFIFTSSSTGCSSDTNFIVGVNPRPEISHIGSDHVCISKTATLAPTVGGVWTSSNNSVAYVNNNGVVTGVSEGTASFSFVQSSTGCASTQYIEVIVNPKPVVEITGNSTICVGTTATLSPGSGGSWISTNPTIASVTNAGIVTAKKQGSAKFTFTSASTGCTATTDQGIVVSNGPTITLNGPSEICIGSETQFLPTSGGSWQSSNASIATINNQGLVTSHAPGIVTFVFTENTTGCKSDTSQYVEVIQPATVFVDGSNSICMAYNTQLSPATGGFWLSTNPSIAYVSSIGLVTGLAPGKVSFYFTDNITGCKSYLPDDAVTIKKCVDPDFNVTLMNTLVSGNVETNDDITEDKTYGSPILDSKPDGSLATLHVYPDGSYVFSANHEGRYEYHVPVCIAPVESGCPSTELIFTVIDALSNSCKLTVNTDFATVYEDASLFNSPTTQIMGMNNDKCTMDVDCDINPESTTITGLPSHGSSFVMVGGNIEYSVNSDFVGEDTIYYKICEATQSTQCVVAKQIITVNAQNATNTTVAVDDFLATKQGEEASINVIVNDSDPEADAISIQTQGSASAPIVTSFGSYYLVEDGTLTFIPALGFFGPAEIVYTLCDDNINQFCTKATVHILVSPDFKIKIKAYLQGALMNNGNQNGPDGKPLMRDNLRNSPFTGLNYIPKTDPYSTTVKYVNLDAKFDHVGVGGNMEFRTIADSAAVFGVTGPNAIVDWVFVELRSKNDYGEVLATRSALIQRDGDVVDLDGIAALRFPGVFVDSFYVVLRHRNHLGIMSQKVSNNQIVDFRSLATPLFDFGTSLYNGINYTGLATDISTKPGYRALWAGDFDANGKLKFTNPNDDQNVLFFEVLSDPGNITSNANYNFAYGYNQGDFDLNSKSKYDNPDDDKNMIFAQILLFPLNTQLLSNFNYIIEQLPARN